MRPMMTPYPIPAASRKLLALDVGLARIGVATCDPLGLSVRPLTTLVRQSRRQDFAALAEMVRQEEATAVVVGLPLHDSSNGEPGGESDQESDQSRTVRKWAERLAHALRLLLGTPLPVIFWDERFSTFEAAQILAEGGERLAQVGEDAVAAAVILQRYLDAQARGDGRTFGRIELAAKASSTVTGDE